MMRRTEIRKRISENFEVAEQLLTEVFSDVEPESSDRQRPAKTNFNDLDYQRG
ncbi:MAG: hypothetical protein GY696_00275 [Gammaproteobacteria bacterium]|nr:hypothetical protein [Gammaproteobacteria bacterium]